jgi:hypothetical protein
MPIKYLWGNVKGRNHFEGRVGEKLQLKLLLKKLRN